MIKIKIPIAAIIVVLTVTGCGRNVSSKKESTAAPDTVSVPDTGFTGIRKYFTKGRLFKEVTFKNSIKEGETKTYYQGGQLYQTFWYENGLKEDSSRWYYLEGQVYRSTPFEHDTINGTQKQYYRDGRIKAKLHYIKGLRTPFLEEYTRAGKLVTGYPDIVYSIIDNYRTTGKVRINLEITDKIRKVKFYQGEFTGGVFDTVRCALIPKINGKTYLDLKKTGKPQPEYIGIIAAILTDFGNNYLIYKKIDLPYKDLK